MLEGIRTEPTAFEGVLGARVERAVPAKQKRTISAVELDAMDFPPISFVVPDVLPEGLALLAGKPKFGKSFMALGLAIAVGSGGLALGSIPCDEGDVLYCALEDSKRRLQSRLRQMLPHGRMPGRLSLATDWPRIGTGFEDELSQWLDDHPGARLVILDTWACIKPQTEGRRSAYDEDQIGLRPLLELAKSRPNLCILVIHHVRKAEADDVFDTISGTNGLTGVPDTILVVAKHGETTKLCAKGRDLEDFERELRREHGGGWTIGGDARQLAKTSERQAILDVLDEAEGETLSLATIASATGKRKDNLGHLLKRLADEGLVEKAGYGKYRAKPHSNYSNRSNFDGEAWVRSNLGADDEHSLNELNGLNGAQHDY
jgi:DNA-binding transcriptional ArsR family regulator